MSVAQRRYFAFDESCPLNPKLVYPNKPDLDPKLSYPFVVGVVSDDPKTVARTKKIKHNFNKLSSPEGDFRYIRIAPEMYSAARQIYPQPETRTEMSWNGHFYEFRLRTDAIIKLLLDMDFDPTRDVTFIDGFGKCRYLREGVKETWQRNTGVEPANSAIICKRGVDRQHILGNTAHRNARKLVDRWEHSGEERRYLSCEVPFTRDDLVSLNLNRHEQRMINKLFADEAVVPAA